MVFRSDGEARGQAHPAVGPRRLRIPLLGEGQPLGEGGRRRLERESRSPAQLLRERAAERVGDVGLAPLEHGQARRLVRDRAEHQALHRGAFAPVAVERLEHQLDPGGERDEAIGPGADRRLLEAVLAHPLHVALGNDPGGPGRGRRVEGHEVRPGLLEADAHVAGVHDFHRGHPRLEGGRGPAPVALEGELHVLRGDRVAVVEAHADAEHEVVDEPVGRDAPRLGQARRHRGARHGLGERVVQRVQDHERHDDPGRLRGVEPRGRERDVHRPGQLALRRGGHRNGPADRQQQEADDRPDAGHGITARVAASASRATSSAGRFHAAGLGAS